MADSLATDTPESPGAGESRGDGDDRGQRPRVPQDQLRDDVACLVCGSRDSRVLFTAPPYRIVRCTTCSLVYTLPRLPSDQIQAMYQTDYWQSDEAKSFGYTDYLRDAPLYLRTFRMRAGLIARHKPKPGRVLEVGCAAGFFLKAMEERGWATTGVELSRQMVRYARHRLCLPDVRAGTLADQDLADRSFDVIAFWDVVEHLEDSRPVLRRARDLLADDGIIIIETQNVESLFAKIMGRRWQHYKFEEHLWHFSRRTLARLLDSVGLEYVEVSPRRAGKYVSLEFIIERAGRVHPWLSYILRPLKPLGRINLYVNPMDELIAVVRKKTG